MKKILLGFTTLACAVNVMAQQKTYDLYVVAEGNFGSPNGDVFKASKIDASTHLFSNGLFQTANNSLGIDVLQDYGTFGNKAILCGKGGSSSPYKLAIVNYPSFDSIKTFTGGSGIQCLGKASNTKAYASMATGNTIQLIDLVTNTLTPVSNPNSLITSYASYMAPANGFEYVAIGSKLVKIDTATNTATTSILPNIGSILGMQYDAANNCIWLLGKVAGTSVIVKLEPGNNDLLNTPITLTGITNAAQLRLGANKLYFLSGKNVYTYDIANPIIPTPLIYTSSLTGNSYSFAYGKSFDVDAITGDFAVSTAGNYAEPTKYEIVDGTTFQQIDTGSVAGRIGNELELHTYTTPIPETSALPDIYEQCAASLTAPNATANGVTITATTTDSTNYNSQGNYTVTWTYTNGYNTTSQTQQVFIQDTIAPIADSAVLPNLQVTCPYTMIPPTATDNCAGAITATTDSLTFTTGGSYDIQWQYTDGHGNSSTQTQHITISCNTAINDINKNAGTIQLFPNPATNLLHIHFKDRTMAQPYIILIQNTLGQTVLVQQTNQTENAVNISSLRKGMYLVKIQTNGNTSFQTAKVIVE